MTTIPSVYEKFKLLTQTWIAKGNFRKKLSVPVLSKHGFVQNAVMEITTCCSFMGAVHKGSTNVARRNVLPATNHTEKSKMKCL